MGTWRYMAPEMVRHAGTPEEDLDPRRPRTVRHAFGGVAGVWVFAGVLVLLTGDV